MAKAITKPTLNVTIAFEVNESEARALDALAGYGDDAFIQAFYVNLGRSYMEKHESGLRTFLESIRAIVRPGLSVIDKARKVLVNEPTE
jgi:hypothetical protein